MSVEPRSLAIDLATEAFLTPTRQSVDPFAEAHLGDLFWVNGPAGRIAVRRRGKGPQVLLVHGWSGSGSDLACFVEPLVDAGFRVLTADLPGHGQSDGEISSIPLAADAIVEIERVVGHLHAVIAHSAGTAAVVHAMSKGFHPERLVLLGGPARYLDQARGFARRAGLNASELDEMLSKLARRGIDVKSISTAKAATTRTEPVLFIHSVDDKVVPIADSHESAAGWKGAQFLRFEGLGHRRILRSPQVISAAVHFVDGERDPRHDPLLLTFTH